MRSDLFRIFRKLRPEQLGLDPHEGFDSPDLGLKDTAGRVRLMFGVYSEEGLRKAFETYGSIERLEARGVGPLEVRLNLDDPFRPNIQLWSRKYKAPATDTVLSLTTGKALGLAAPFHQSRLLSLESVLLQHPGKDFDWSRPPLPEQNHPGLSLSGEVLDLLILVARRINADGMVLVPSTFHAARIYERHFQFVDGSAEGDFRALRHTGELRPLWLLSWAISLGCVTDDGEPFTWKPAMMMAPLKPELGQLFESGAYQAAVAAREWSRLAIDFDLLRERFPWELMPKSRPPALICALLQPKLRAR